MFKMPDVITINGKGYSEDEFTPLIADKLSSPHLPDWERELYTFLKEWFSLSDFIEALTSGSTGDRWSNGFDHG